MLWTYFEYVRGFLESYVDLTWSTLLSVTGGDDAPSEATPDEPLALFSDLVMAYSQAQKKATCVNRLTVTHETKRHALSSTQTLLVPQS